MAHLEDYVDGDTYKAHTETHAEDQAWRELAAETTKLVVQNATTNREQTETLEAVSKTVSVMSDLLMNHQKEILHTGASLRTLWVLFVINIVGTWGVLFYLLN